MNHEFERDMEKIVARCYPPGEERQLLSKIFSALAAHQKIFLDDIERRFVTESAQNNFGADFDVATTLLKRDDLENQPNFSPMKTDSDLIFAQQNESPFENFSPPEENAPDFFLDVSYDNLKNFCEPKTYRGQLVTADGTTKKFSYTLQRHEKFIRQEEILFKLVAMYRIRRPVIFSPYARKAVVVKVDGVELADLHAAKNFNLQLVENNLDGKLLIDRKLCWNVKISNVDTNLGGEVEEYFGADGKLIRYEYFHTFNRDAKIFVLPNQHCDDFNITTDDVERKIQLGYNSVLKERTCQIVELNPVEKFPADIFTNDFPRKNSKMRLRTEGDLEKVLACFNETRFGQIFPAHFGGYKNPRPITIYRREDSYPSSAENRLLGSMRSKSTCFVKFSGDSNSKFKTDYANYVLYYLAQNYPEFIWAGVDA